MAGRSQNLKGRGVGQHEHSHTSYKQCACMCVCICMYVCMCIHKGLVSLKTIRSFCKIVSFLTFPSGLIG